MVVLKTEKSFGRLEKVFNRLKEEGRPSGTIELLGTTGDGLPVVEVELDCPYADVEILWDVVGYKEATDETMSVGVTFADDGVAAPRNDMRCENCHRLAGKLMLIRHRKTGEVKQVGRACLRNLLGYDAEAAIVLREERLRDSAEPWGNRGFHPETLPLATYLAEARRSTKEDGYIKSNPDLRFGQMTKGAAWYAASERGAETATPEELEYLETIRAWAATKDASQEFWSNIQNILSGRYVSKKHIGLIACLPSMYDRDLERAKKKAEREAMRMACGARDDAFAPAEIGAKVEIKAVLERRNYFDTQWGTTFVLSFRGEDGFLYVWKTSKPPDETVLHKNGSWTYETCEGLEIGRKYVLKGKVKEKKEYKDLHQTVLTRCKVAPVTQRVVVDDAPAASDDTEKALEAFFAETK